MISWKIKHFFLQKQLNVSVHVLNTVLHDVELPWGCSAAAPADDGWSVPSICTVFGKFSCQSLPDKDVEDQIGVRCHVKPPPECTKSAQALKVHTDG